MSVGPLRRAVATLGLLGLAPTGYLLAQGAIAPEVAAVRALVVMVAVMVVGRVLTAMVRGALATVERQGQQPDGAQTAGASAAATSGVAAGVGADRG